MTALTIGVITGGIFVVIFAVVIIGILSLLAALESTIRTRWS